METGEERLPVEVLKPLCSGFREEADTLLDLYAMTQEAGHPGKCVKCFYRLMGRARHHETGALVPLRKWIEDHIEVSIRAGTEQAGSLPVRLEAPDLEDFCDEVIRNVRADPKIAAPEVELGFTYARRERTG